MVYRILPFISIYLFNYSYFKILKVKFHMAYAKSTWLLDSNFVAYKQWCSAKFYSRLTVKHFLNFNVTMLIFGVFTFYKITGTRVT